MQYKFEEFINRRAKNGFAIKKKELISYLRHHEIFLERIRNKYPANDTPEDQVVIYKQSLRNFRLTVEELEAITHPFKTGGHH